MSDYFDVPVQTIEEVIQEHFERIISSKQWARIAKEDYGLNYKTEYHRHREYRISVEIDLCGEYRQRVDAASGRYISYKYRCKHYAECPKCNAYRIKDEVDRAYALLGHKVLTGSQEEIKSLLSDYKKEDYLLKPLKDGKSMAIFHKDSEIGEYFDMEHIYLLEQEFLTHGRRTSGALQVSTAIPQPDKGEIIEIAFRDMKIEFTNEEGPQSLSELETIVQNEVEITQHPASEEQLQYCMYVMENKTRDVCQRYGIKFNFYSTKKRRIGIKEIDWEWLKDKLGIW